MARRRLAPTPLPPEAADLVDRLRRCAAELEAGIGERRDDAAFIVWQEAIALRWKADQLEAEGVDPPRVFLAWLRARVAVKLHEVQAGGAR